MYFFLRYEAGRHMTGVEVKGRWMYKSEEDGCISQRWMNVSVKGGWTCNWKDECVSGGGRKIDA